MRAAQILELDHFASKSEAYDLETLRTSMSLTFLTEVRIAIKPMSQKFF